jgi:hypothetical protein
MNDFLANYKILVIGLGKVGFTYDLENDSTLLTHVKSIKAVSKILKINSTIYAVEPNVANMNIFKQRYPDDYVYADYKSLKVTEYDLAIVCCNTEFIINTYLDVISKFDIKKIILEKPVSNNISDFNRLLAYAEHKINLRVGFPRRSLPSTYFLKNCINLTNINCQWNLQLHVYGDMLNIGIHFLDLIYYLFGPFQISNYQKNDNLVSFEANNDALRLLVNQKSQINEEKSSIIFSGPLEIRYENSGRHICIKPKSFETELTIGSSSEIEQMIGFEAFEYLCWMLGRSVPSQPTLMNNPIKELLSKGGF